ncbi:putative tryptophanyl-tRNA synthetase [Candidatus Hodgkinia cicadicola Dsem]|nr:putative tryptophanyl-tRNA synthetase [Candidatus Hodgkinia cicadicola Dsem]
MFGMQPTGWPHLGNYLCLKAGCAARASKLVCCVADLHSLTSLSPAGVRRVRLTAAFVMACVRALSSSRALVYVQSDVVGLGKLAWVAACNAKLAELERASAARDSATAAGLFYPNLMAGDVLACRPTLLAVGLDQRRHVQHVRAVGNKLNARAQRAMGARCALCPPLLLAASARVKLMSLSEPNVKMSKSKVCGLLGVFDGYRALSAKLARARTDGCAVVARSRLALKNRPGVGSLLALYAATAGVGVARAIAEVCGVETRRLKTWAASLVYTKLRAVRLGAAGLMASPKLVDGALAAGGRAMKTWTGSAAAHALWAVGLG